LRPGVFEFNSKASSLKDSKADGMSSNGRRNRRWWYSFWLIFFLLLAVAGGFILKARRSNGTAPNISSAEVKLVDFVDYVEMRGEIRVRSSTVISAPYNAGDLQLLKLTQDGSEVKKGDVVVQFDPSPLQL
jgi:multidrug efflux pump subunit AcrA (membrane-fusion protein)